MPKRSQGWLVIDDRTFKKILDGVGFDRQIPEGEEEDGFYLEWVPAESEDEPPYSNDEGIYQIPIIFKEEGPAFVRVEDPFPNAEPPITFEDVGEKD